MTKICKAFAAQTSVMSDRQVRVIANTGTVDRTGEQVVLAGVNLANFLANPVILYQHDPNIPVGSASDVLVTPSGIEMTINFAPAGVSAKADEVCGLMKARVLNAVSIGFDPIETEPMNPADRGKKNAPQRYLMCDLMETSVVSIPADSGALVIQRTVKSAAAEKWTCAAAKDLEIDVEADWNGRDAAERILDDAGFNGDSPDPDKAKKGFLAYDAANPTLKGSYKLPFADVQKGKLVAVASGIRAAASRLPQADIPDDVQAAARKVLDAYEAVMEKTDDNKKGAGARRVKTMTQKTGTGLVLKDLYDVAHLAYLLNELGWMQAGVRIEAALEGDGSTLPEQLAGVMQDLGAALVAMTAEEVAEAVAEAQGSLGQEENTAGLDAADVVLVQAGKTPLVRRFRAYVAKAGMVAKAGKKISADTADALGEAQGHHDEALGHVREAIKCMTKGGNVIKGLLDGADSGTQGSQTTDDDTTGAKAAQAERQKALAAQAARQKALAARRAAQV